MEIKNKNNLLYYKAIVTYQGTYFQGWQSQKSNVPTIQNTIENALYKIFKFQQRIIGASRTDSGVHAWGQVFCFFAPMQIKEEKLLSLINNNLPDTIYIHSLQKIDTQFHPRFNAKKKIYQYLLSKKKLCPSINFFILYFQNNFNLELLMKSTQLFIGKHDFRAFCSLEKDQNTIRIIENITIESINDIYIVTIIGNGFLRYMIRRILGAALTAATEKTTIQEIKNILINKNPNHNLLLLPAKGLLLKNIIYEDHEVINNKNPFLNNFNFY